MKKVSHKNESGLWASCLFLSMSESKKMAYGKILKLA